MRCSKSTITYIKQEIKRACEIYKGRTAGSPAERKCQAHFAKELRKWSDSVRKETFTLHPDAFLGWIVPSALLNMGVVALLWARMLTGWTAAPTLAFACASLSVLLCLGEFILYRKTIDFAYPEKESVNVYACRKPTGEIRQRIIFGGHADAAHEMTYVLHPNKRMIYKVIGGALAGMAYLWATSLAFLIGSRFYAISLGGWWLALAALGLLCVPAFVASLFFINRKKVADGANDNLSGCLVSMGVLREMACRGIRLEHTELCCLITGGEESGLRGAMAFAKAHKQALRDVDTIFVALETLREEEQLMVYTRGINGTQKNSAAVADLIREAGRRQNIRLRDAGIYPGATDAEAFSREGLAACGLGGVNHSPQPYYHTRHDTYENISEACIRLSLDVCLEAALLFDQRVSKSRAANAC